MGFCYILLFIFVIIRFPMRSTVFCLIIIFFVFIFADQVISQEEQGEGPPEWMQDIEVPAVTVPAKEEPIPVKEEPLVEPKSFVDLPDKHWARDAVYDLVKMGITQGYPDGTFRGWQRITRYETAMFLNRMSNLVSTMATDLAEARKKEFEEKYAPKLKASLDEIKKEIELLKAPEIPRPEFGYFEAKLKLGNFTSIGSTTSTQEVAVGPRLDWRLKMSFEGGISEWLYGEANFDTMDAGWGGSPGRTLVTNFIDVSGRVKSPWDFDVFFTAGPGPIVHSEEAGSPFPSENGIAFVRPRNSVGAEGKLSEADWLLSYATTRISQTGEADISSYKLKLGYNFDEDTSFIGIDEISTTLDYNVRVGEDPADALKEKIFFSFKPKWGFDFNVAGGLSSVKSTGKNYYYEFGIRFKDLLREGMIVELSAVRIGAEYLNYLDDLGEETMLGVNYFDKLLYIPGGGADLGIRITHDVSEATRLKARGELVLDDALSYGKDSPGTYTTFEIGMDYLTYTYSSLGFVYRIHHEPSLDLMPTSDMLAIVANYAF